MVNSIFKNIKKNYKKIPKDFLYVYFFDLLTKILGFLVMILLIRILSKEAYSNYTLFISISSFIFGVFSSGLSLAYIRYTTEGLSRNNSINYKLYYLILMLPIFGFAPIFIFQDYISALLRVNVNIVSLSIIFAALLYLNRINQSHFQAQEKYKYGGLIETVKNIVIITLIPLSFFLFEFSILSILIIYIISALISFTIGFKKIRNERLNSEISSNDSIRRIFKESGWLIFYGLLLNAFNQLDTFMIAYYLGETEIANYGVAFKYYILVLSLLPAIQTVIRVRTSKKEMIDSNENQIDFTRKWIKKIWPISLFLVIALVTNSFWFFPLLNGKQYNISIIPFNILAIGAGISYLFAPNVGILMSSKRYLLLSIYAAAALIFNIIGNVLLIPSIGISGAAITTVISQAVINVLSTISIFHVKKKKSIGG